MTKDWLGLSQKTIIVTGGASGIGKAIAKELVECGANTVVTDLSVKDGDDQDGAYCIQSDVTNEKSVQRMIDAAVKHFGQVDGIVNNAGINRPRLLVDFYKTHPEYELKEKDFGAMVSVNQKGLLFCAQEAARQMLKQGGGVIVNVSSESGLEGSAGQSCYAATKAATMAFTRSWAKELGSKNIRVVAIAPGILEKTGLRTPAYNEALAYTRGTTPDQLNSDYSKSIPLGRPGRLVEVADAVTYLLSDRASYITGTCLNISGGKSRG
ncbi:MAG TPA: sorbitol-6-phosphate 2-dehydrogenase [Clostridiales bacterium]|jgi:sorbitol-6-phosphate 2-dehydrogenase|nr:sorbitol-6-phosphate 2-dehydrogenase [Clostridiales bacterium]